MKTELLFLSLLVFAIIKSDEDVDNDYSKNLIEELLVDFKSNVIQQNDSKSYLKIKSENQHANDNMQSPVQKAFDSIELDDITMNQGGDIVGNIIDQHVEPKSFNQDTIAVEQAVGTSTFAQQEKVQEDNADAALLKVDDAIVASGEIVALPLVQEQKASLECSSEQKNNFVQKDNEVNNKESMAVFDLVESGSMLSDNKEAAHVEISAGFDKYLLFKIGFAGIVAGVCIAYRKYGYSGIKQRLLEIYSRMKKAVYFFKKNFCHRK